MLSRRLLLVIVSLLLVVVIVGSIVVWWQPSQSPKLAFFTSQTDSWSGLRPGNAGDWLISFNEEVSAYCFNEFVSADLTVAVWSETHDYITIGATLNAQRNVTNPSRTIDLNALGFRIHDNNDTTSHVQFDEATSQGQNVVLEEIEAESAWMNKEASAKAPIRSQDSSSVTNASFTIQFKWGLHDLQGVVSRSLNVTGEAYYSELLWVAPSSWFISTSIELRLNPGHLLLVSDFDSGALEGWSVGDDNAASGLDYWGVSSVDYYSPNFAVWCAATNDGTQGTGLYDNRMNSYLRRDLPDFSNFSMVYLYFKAWIETQEQRDYFYVEYFDSGLWKKAATHTGPMSVSPSLAGGYRDGWFSLRVELPTSATSLQFRFYSDETTAFRGVYVDNIILLAA